MSLDAHAVLLPQFAGLHDFACMMQLRGLVAPLRKAGQRFLGTLKMFDQVIVAPSVFIPFLRRIERQQLILPASTWPAAYLASCRAIPPQ